VLKEISQYTKEGWPVEKLLNSEYQQYYKRREKLSLVNDSLILGNRVVIPKSLREDVLVLLYIKTIRVLFVRKCLQGRMYGGPILILI
jgi:hypothetical protein